MTVRFDAVLRHEDRIAAMPLTAFGPGARDYAARLPAELDLLVYDETGFAEALDHALEREYARGPFLCAPIIGDRRSHVALAAARDIITTQPDYSDRRASLDLVRAGRYSFDGRHQVDHESFTKKERDSIADVLSAAGGVIVRSWSELLRLSHLFGVHPIRTARAVAAPLHEVPHFRPRNGAQTIAVWAPQLDAGRASMFAFALMETKAPVVIICSGAAGGERLGLRARFIESTDRAAIELLLDETSALVDTNPDDPASAIALAGSGLPLAASQSSGAFEYVDGIYAYDAWDYRSILHAALAALGGEPPAIRAAIPRPADIMATPPRIEPPTLQDPPLVSVVLPTRDRRGILPRAIDSIARQTYPNIEVVVVNDGGVPVADLVARLPAARIIDNEESQGVTHAQNAAFEQTRGRYVAFLSDDDYLFPTYFSRLVYAMERTGCPVAAGMCADSYLEPGESPYYDFIGTSIRPYRSTDPTVLHTIPHSMPAFVLVRRDVQAQIGTWNPLEPIYNDYARILCLLERNDCLWVSHVVANMDMRLDRSSFSSRIDLDHRIADLARIWETYPRTHRPDIIAERERMLQLYRDRRPSPMLPLHRGVTRVAPRASVYRLD